MTSRSVNEHLASSDASTERGRQLDLFRGIAAIFMIVNHAGYEWLGPASYTGGWATWLVFVGSAAPALFFYATGVGSGLSNGRGEPFVSAMRKVVLLLLADTLMNWGNGTLLGLDFFGFAAVATFTLFLVRRASRAVLIAAALLVLVIIARFGLVAFSRDWVDEDSVLAFLTGLEPVEHVSYPLAPWLAFPLLGFLVGRQWRQSGAGHETRVVGGVGVACLLLAAALAAHGAVVFRWGSVSIAYFLCAVGIVAVAWLASGRAARAWAGLSHRLALRGPASLLIVPLHYGALGAVAFACPPPWNPAAWLVATVLLVTTVLLASRGLVAVARHLVAPSVPAQIGIAATACVAAWLAYDLTIALVRLEVASMSEVAIALLLLWSSSKASGKSRQLEAMRT